MCFLRRKKKPKPKPPVPTPGPPVVVPPVPPVGTVVQLVNRCTVVSDVEVIKVAAALQVQVTRDYVPLWGGGPWTVQAIGKTAKTSPVAWQVLVLDNSDVAGALGYHDVTPQGLPLGRVFAATDKQYGIAWSTTASHELLEMLGDPNIDKTVKDPQTGWVYAYENCDAVETAEYLINGVAVSDFVTPEWFRRPAKGRVDVLDRLTQPFTLDTGGYISVDKGQGWVQQYGQYGPAGHGYSARPKVGSRRERRGVPKEHWLRSSSVGELPVR